MFFLGRYYFGEIQVARRTAYLPMILILFICFSIDSNRMIAMATITNSEENPTPATTLAPGDVEEQSPSPSSSSTTNRQESNIRTIETPSSISQQLLLSMNENSSANIAGNFYPSRKERPAKTEEEIIVRVPQASLGTTASGSPVKPTKYHYYPHNQHIYLLPECAVQQVCNAVYVRLNYTQPLCGCPSRYREPCSASLNSDDLHTTELSTDSKSKVLTLVKTCEPVSEMRLCRNPRDWSLLALQNVRTGKSHYLVICRCPDTSVLEGPMSHDQPTYASVPGIRVYGMVCINKAVTSTSSPVTPSKRKARPMRHSRVLTADLTFPWKKVDELMKYVL